MNYLAIDTSNKNLTVIVKVSDKYYEFFDSECGVNHSVQLMPKIEELLEKAKITLKDLNFIAVVIGPGSFTGIRIGISTAKALCFSNGISILSITSFDTIAYNVKNGKNLAVIDAGHNGYYVQGYNDGKVIYPPKYVMGEELEQLKKEYAFLSFSKLEKFESNLENLLTGLKNAIEFKKGEVTDNLDSVNPLYIRKSQAEEGR